MNSLRVRALWSAAKSAHSRGTESPSASRSASPVMKMPEKPALSARRTRSGMPPPALALARARVFARSLLSFQRAGAME